MSNEWKDRVIRGGIVVVGAMGSIGAMVGLTGIAVGYPDEDLEARDAVHRIPDGDGRVPGLGERAGNVLHPVDGLEVRTLLPTDYRPPLT